MKKTALLIFTLVLVLCSVAFAEFPEKQITVVCPYAAGGASDTTSRIYASMLQKAVGVPVIVDNRTGSNGAVGMTYGAQAAPDGYTVSYMPAEISFNKLEGIGNVTPEDFRFLGIAMTIPAAITVKADSEWKTFEDFLKYAKENPGEITIGNSGSGSLWHIAAAAVEKACDIELEHIPYPAGASAAIAGLLGGEIDAVAVSGAEVSTYVADGQLRTLVVLGSNRCSAESLKDVPTTKELGYEVPAIEGWGGFAVPKATDDAVVAKLVEASKSAINSQEMIDLLASKGYEHVYKGGADADAYAKTKFEDNSKLVPTLKLK